MKAQVVEFEWEDDLLKKKKQKSKQNENQTQSTKENLSPPTKELSSSCLLHTDH